MNVLRLIDRVFRPEMVFAHCDVPCGIYDPKTAQIAAETVVKMVEKMLDEPLPENGKPHQIKSSVINYENAMARYVFTKEEHARKCKKELLILWTDFFKPEHLKMFPKLHDTFWKAAKLCSQNKQTVDMKAAKELKRAVDDIAKIFAKAKAAGQK